MFLSANSNICISYGWFQFIGLFDLMGSIFLFLCMPGNFLLDARHHEFLPSWVLDIVYLYIVFLLWKSAKLLENSLVLSDFAFKICLVGQSKV